jgi:hypothetical protein
MVIVNHFLAGFTNLETSMEKEKLGATVLSMMEMS